MRRQQLNVFKGIGFLIVLAIGLAVFQPAKAASVAITARPVVISRPAVSTPTVRVSTPTPPPARVSPPPMRSSGSYRSMNESAPASTPMPMPLYVPMFIGGSGASASEATEVATPLLTKCTVKEFEQARLWQEDCKNLKEVQSGYCPLLSYFRYCKETTPEEAQDLKPAGEKYKHVFLTGS